MNNLPKDLVKVINGIEHINNNNKQSIFTKDKMKKLVNYVKIWSKIIKGIDLQYDLDPEIKLHYNNKLTNDLPNKKVLYIINLVLNFYDKTNYYTLPYDKELFEIKLFYYNKNHVSITFNDIVDWYKLKYTIIPRYFYTLETESEVYCNCRDFIKRHKINYVDINPRVFKRKSDFSLFKLHNKELFIKYPQAKLISHEYYL